MKKSELKKIIREEFIKVLRETEWRLNEAVEMQPVMFSSSDVSRVYDKDEYRAGAQGNKLFVSDKSYSRGKPIHITKISWTYIAGSNRLYSLTLSGMSGSIKISGFRADDVLHAIAITVGSANVKQLLQRYNIKSDDFEMDVS
jgi:hypothetical protein